MMVSNQMPWAGTSSPKPGGNPKPKAVPKPKGNAKAGPKTPKKGGGSLLAMLNQSIK